MGNKGNRTALQTYLLIDKAISRYTWRAHPVRHDQRGLFHQKPANMGEPKPRSKKRGRTIYVSLRETLCGPVCKPVQAESEASLRRGAGQGAGAAPALRYGPAGDSAPRLRLKAAGMTERFPFGPANTARKSTPRCPFGRIAIYSYRTLPNEIQDHWLICIPLNSPPLQIGPQRSRARSGEANP